MHKVSNKDTNKAQKCISYLKQLISCDFSFLNEGKKIDQAEQESMIYKIT